MNRRIIIRRARYALATLALCVLCACGAAPVQDNAANVQATPEPVREIIQDSKSDSTPKPEAKPESTPRPEPRDAAELINMELDTLRRLGLLMADFEVTRDDCDASFITAGKISADFTGSVCFRNAGYNPELCFAVDYDAGMGKITAMTLEHRPQEGCFTSENGLYYYNRYDNFEDIVSPELTVGDYCEAWAQYWGCESCELPQGADPEAKFADAYKLDTWPDSGERAVDLRVAFYREGQSAPEYAWLRYGAAYQLGPYICLGDLQNTGVATAAKTVYYVDLINAELDTMRELGLFKFDFEVLKNGKENVDDDGYVRIQEHWSDDRPCSYNVRFDPADEQVTMLFITPRPQDDWESVTADSGLEVYDRLDAIIDPEMTLRDYCDAWAQYRGYNGYVLDVDPDTPMLELPLQKEWADGIVWDGGHTVPGLTIEFHPEPQSEPVYGYIQYNATTDGPEFCFGEGFTLG